jgi:hypothetical protein
VLALVIVADSAAGILCPPGEPPIMVLAWLVVDLNVGLTLFAMARLVERVRRASAQQPGGVQAVHSGVRRFPMS